MTAADLSPSNTAISSDSAGAIAQRISAERLARPGLSYGAAREVVRRTSPELFGLPARGQAPAFNRASAEDCLGQSSEARAASIAQAVQSVRAEHPELSYEDARRAARSRSPEAFGLGAGGSSSSFNRGASGAGDENPVIVRNRRDFAIQDYMRKNGCAFEHAVWTVRTLHPELFAR